MSLFLSVLAACAYATGGIFMKQSDGLTRPAPSALIFVCFLAGAALQTWSMRGVAMSTNYIIVLGLEAAVALALGMAVFGEPLTLPKSAGVALVVAGVALLRLD